MQFVGAPVYLIVQCVGPIAQFPITFLHLIQQGIQMIGNLANFIFGFNVGNPRVQLAFFNPPHGLVHLFKRAKYAAGNPQEKRHRQGNDNNKCAHKGKVYIGLQIDKRLFQKTDIKHADAHIFKKQGGGAGFAIVDLVSRVNKFINRINKIQISVQKVPPIKTPLWPAIMIWVAPNTTMPRFSISRLAGMAASVWIRGVLARRANSGAIDLRFSYENSSIEVAVPCAMARATTVFSGGNICACPRTGAQSGNPVPTHPGFGPEKHQAADHPHRRHRENP